MKVYRGKYRFVSEVLLALVILAGVLSALALGASVLAPVSLGLRFFLLALFSASAACTPLAFRVRRGAAVLSCAAFSTFIFVRTPVLSGLVRYLINTQQWAPDQLVFVELPGDHMGLIKHRRKLETLLTEWLQRRGV